MGRLARHQPDATPAGLRRLLIEAIELLKPAATTPPDSSDWRYYRILYHRYVEQFSQQQVAANLALSIRQLRREEAEAVRLLAGYLRSHYDLPQSPAPDAARRGGSGTTPFSDPPAGDSLREQELRWVESSFPRELADLQTIVEVALATIQPLVELSRVNLRCKGLQSLPRVFVQPGSVQQALLNVLTVAVLAVPEGWVTLNAQSREREAWIAVEARASRPADSPLARRDLEALEVARQLLALSGGRLEVQMPEQGAERLVATLKLPTEERATVLVIDDNADALRLVERYLTGTRYIFASARSAEEALELAVEKHPRAIALDIMLPGVDGWRLLGRLREHPQLRGVPIIVCSILPQEELALALGAVAFLHKPFTRQALLAALDATTKELRN